MADSKAMRRYHAGIERALALFDATNEWADYIAFLSRLLKSLQGPPPDADIPLKVIIARYLARCLQPSLPSGVHQKALEVYDNVFSIVGPQQLGEDLPLYLPGLANTLSFASLSTRPQFLALYNDHILTLPAFILRPAIRALIMSMLPGIEEDTSEDFEQTLTTFNRLRQIFTENNHEEVFWQNLFLASITSPGRRAGVLVYITRHLPKLVSQSASSHGGIESQQLMVAAKAIITPEPGLLVRCFATGLQDSQPLVQRGFLDLLVSHLPLDATIFAGDAHASDLDVLVNASAAVVLRRDMGLNRRLWAWYTGSEVKTASDASRVNVDETPNSPLMSRDDTQSADYFRAHGLASLVRSMSQMLRSTSREPIVKARPFRIALSLMDRWDIGGPVVESLFIPLLQSLQFYQATAPSQEAFDDVFRSANVFFDGVESRLIASQLLLLVQQHDLDLFVFILTNFNLEEEEMLNIHVPFICIVIVECIQEQLGALHDVPAQSSDLNVDILGQILENLLALTPVGVLRGTQSQSLERPKLKEQVIQHYYKTAKASDKGVEGAELHEMVGRALLEGIFDCLQLCISQSAVSSNLVSHAMACMDQVIALSSELQTLESIHFIPILLQKVRDFTPKPDDRLFYIIVSITKIVATLHVRDTLQKALKPSDLCAIVPLLVDQLWHFLLPSTPQYHVEAVESIWRLHIISRSLRLVESTIIALLLSQLPQLASREWCMQRFGTLWIHSRAAAKQLQSTQTENQTSTSDDVLDLLQHPLLQIIDAIDGSLTAHPCAIWLRSLPSLNMLFGVVFMQLPKDNLDASSTSLVLQRLGKLIDLARSNDAQWKAFAGKSGYRDAVFELCSSLTSNQALVNSLGVESLQVVRLLVSDAGIGLGDDVVKMLSTRLVSSYAREEFQNALLDTLQAAFSAANPPHQPEYLLPILLDGISSPDIDITLDKWITLLCTIVPLLGSLSLFSNLLKITNCMCQRVEAYFNGLQDIYTSEVKSIANGAKSSASSATNPERSIFNLLSGMEYIIARAHHQASLPRGEQDSGLNGSSVDVPSSRSSANDRLTVVLCMQDALKVCSRLWFWRSTGKAITTTVDMKSMQYMSLRLRSRSRRILENLVEAEAQECLETLMGLWVEKRSQNSQHNQVLDLLQTLDGARPKFMIPATFNAIYNRTNPNALDRSQKSSLSINVNAFELIAFLNDYTSALEDDLLDEIWADCTTFLREVLSNPMPHRQILFKLLEFTAVLCRKMENTNFGEEVRMRKELADLCTRLFTAIFTIKPQGFDGSGSKSADIDAVFDKKRLSTRSSVQAGNALQILQEILPDLTLVLSLPDRLTTVYSGIATNISGPLLHAKMYPQNVSAELLVLLQTMSTAPAATKTWRKDVADAFNDAKFFQTEVQLVELGWLPLIRQLVLTDKTIMPEYLGRLAPPAAAGLMFGVGASAARTEADKRTQSNLRRIALLALSMELDYFVPSLQSLLVKLEELLTATPESSPSSNSKDEVYITLRTILLTFSQPQLSTLWPLVDNELRELCSAMITKDFTKFNLSAQLQGAKLLDLLLLMKPDEFQLHEWLFVTDTMDAIYPSAEARSIALADRIILSPQMGHLDPQTSLESHLKKPWLCTDESREEEKIESLLASFFAHLSIRTFEATYSLQRIDLKACRDDLIKDLFTE